MAPPPPFSWANIMLRAGCREHGTSCSGRASAGAERDVAVLYFLKNSITLIFLIFLDMVLIFNDDLSDSSSDKFILIDYRAFQQSTKASLKMRRNSNPIFSSNTSIHVRPVGLAVGSGVFYRFALAYLSLAFTFVSDS